jgi:pimeloyl-ACP methyl ester carboxylesterase
MLARMQRLAVQHPSYRRPILTATVAPSDAELEEHGPNSTPIVCLHGFDSSSLEFRRLYPLLAREAPTWAVDLVRRPRWGGAGAATTASADLVGP